MRPPEPENDQPAAWLSRTRIVLVETSHPGNIGAAARAMMTMRLERLCLVRPWTFPHPDAVARASGAAGLLENAMVCDSLDDALADCTLVIGASARRRSIPWPELTPRECAGKLREGTSGEGNVALVFGREKTGLSNEELDRCRYLVRIPCNPRFASLNLGSAVQVLCYELLLAAELPEPRVEDPDDIAAPWEDVERMYTHLEETLMALRFLDPENPRHLMRRLRRLYHRAGLTNSEVRILRGILTASLAAAERGAGGPS
ncbi:MAG: RNA methyltransferase [Pseudomonadota bacterium]|nr:RNA methyltransferase [Pseudomonadota bacterium]